MIFVQLSEVCGFERLNLPYSITIPHGEKGEEIKMGERRVVYIKDIAPSLPLPLLHPSSPNLPTRRYWHRGLIKYLQSPSPPPLPLIPLPLPSPCNLNKQYLPLYHSTLLSIQVTKNLSTQFLEFSTSHLDPK